MSVAYTYCKCPQEAAREAYAKRDFRTTLDLVDELVAAQPSVARWHEMRAAVRVDGKQFESALTDFNQAINATPGGIQSNTSFTCCPRCKGAVSLALLYP